MFDDQVSKLHAARQLFRRFQTEVDESYDEWRAQNDAIIARAEQASADMRGIEDGLRARVVMHYQNTGNKKPHPKLGIRAPEVPVYTGDLAYNFALHSVPELLKLDIKAFESYAKGVRASAPLSFVDWEEKVTATIARDLEE